MAGGGDTNRGKRAGEEAVSRLFKVQGIQVIKNKEWNKIIKKGGNIEGTIAVKEFPYTNIYGVAGRMDFLLIKDKIPQTSFEVRHQDVAGSVEDKLPCVVLNGLSAWPTDHGIIILSGKHWESTKGKDVIAYLRKLIDEHSIPNRQLEIYSIEQTTDWLVKTS